jgi:hypothetical protein
MTGTNWNGHRFFGLRQGKTSATDLGTDPRETAEMEPPPVARMARQLETHRHEGSDDPTQLA